MTFRARLLDERIAILERHPDVREQKIEAALVQFLQRGLRRVRLRHARARILQHEREQLPRIIIIIHDECNIGFGKLL